MATCDGSDERGEDDEDEGVRAGTAAGTAGLSHERDQRKVTTEDLLAVTGCMRQEWLVTGAREKRQTFRDLLRQRRGSADQMLSAGTDGGRAATRSVTGAGW